MELQQNLHYTLNKYNRLPNYQKNIDLRQYCLPGCGAWPLCRPVPRETEKYLTRVREKYCDQKIFGTWQDSLSKRARIKLGQTLRGLAEASPTWKWRMMVQMRPRVSLGFPSTMSSPRMLTSLISLYLRNLSAVSTFWIAWNRIRPRSRGCKIKSLNHQIKWSRFRV